MGGGNEKGRSGNVRFLRVARPVVPHPPVGRRAYGAETPLQRISRPYLPAAGRRPGLAECRASAAWSRTRADPGLVAGVNRVSCLRSWDYASVGKSPLEGLREMVAGLGKFVAKSSRMSCEPIPGGVPVLKRSKPSYALISMAVLAAILVAGGNAQAQKNAKKNPAASPAEKHLGSEIVMRGSYPELQVDGEPFFMHSAAFFYYRTPRDQWEHLLDRYKRLGINTIDIYIPWNWHEPKEGELDFDGHTNPRRDLRALLKMIAERHLRLIARPGPEILNEWRNGGYPDWLLTRPEYKMEPIDILEGRYPPLDGLNAKDAEAAAEGWLGNATHMAEAQRWFAAVGKELAPYSSRREWKNPEVKTPAQSESEQRGGPLLFIQLGDDFAIGQTNRTGEAFWKYVEQLREWIEAGGADVPVFINPADMRVPAEGSGFPQPIGVMGQWYLRPGEGGTSKSQALSAQDATEMEFETDELKTQPVFPPAMIEFQPGWYAPADDDRPVVNATENLLLSSRLLIGDGLHGINYFPLQDTLTPAGYSVPWANRSYRWNAALGVDGNARPELAAVERNGNLLDRWGQQLAASHKRADFGIIDPTGSYPEDLLTADEIVRVKRTLERMERTSTLGMFSSELLDPEHQPLDQLMRDAAIILPVFDPEKPEFQMSEAAQREILEYVEEGGTLVLYLGRPAGKTFEELWKTAPAVPSAATESAVRNHWRVGKGDVIECTKDFDSWVALDESFTENMAQRQSVYALGLLKEILTAGGIEPAVRLPAKQPRGGEIIASEIVADEGTETFGRRKGTTGFLSVTNMANGNPADLTLEALAPEAPARGAANNYISVHVVVPPRESLLLPLNQPICFERIGDEPCEDSLAWSGAEFLDARREDKTLELLLYVPAKEELLLHTEQQPSHVSLDDSKPDSQWTMKTKELRVTLPRGPAPSYLRLLKIDMPYTPHVPKVTKEGKPTPDEFTLAVWNSVQLPVSGNQFMRTYPPLILAEPGKTPSVVLSAFNLNTEYPRDAQANIDGPLHGGESYRIGPQSSEVERIKLKASEKDADNPPVAPDGLIHETIIVKSGQDHRVIPVTFVELRAQGTTNYRYDFDRDGAEEWVLENAATRVLVSPESGGRAIALVDKAGGEDLSTSVGLARDNFFYTPNPTGINPARARGLYGMFNRPYAAKWGGDEKNPTLEMQYDTPDVYPAGASIDKTMRLEDPGTLRVDYRVKLAADKSGGDGTEKHEQRFVAVNSFPATDQGEQRTQFCWDNVASGTEVKAAPTCIEFEPGGKTVEAPEGVKKVEVRTPEQPTIIMEWECKAECARLRIEQKNFSGLFLLEFPPLKPGGDEGNYTVRIHGALQTE